MEKVCSVDGCGGYVDSLGYCNKHYLRYRSNGHTDEVRGSHGPLADRFWGKVQIGEAAECWIWLGTMTKNGYGRIGAGGRGGKSLSAHRVSCELHHGAPPFEGAHVMHACDNRACVNPAHLRWATASENIKDAYTKGRKTSPLKRGSMHHMAVLSQDRAKFIRDNPGITVAKLARLFECSRSAVQAVRDGRTWRD